MSGESDPELSALAAVGDALDPLDLGARKRVLGWARDRFENGLVQAIGREQMEAVSAYFAAIDEHARTLAVTPRELTQAFAVLRERRGLSPLMLDPDPEGYSAEVDATESALSEGKPR